MCIAAPGKITAIVDSMASISYFDAQERKAMIADVVPKVGDYVSVQMGIVIKILSETEARQAISAWKEIS